MDILATHRQALKKQYQQLSLTTNEYHDRLTIIEHIHRNSASATWMLAGTLKQPAAKVRRVMRKMEADGIVALSPYASANNLVWMLVETP